MNIFQIMAGRFERVVKFSLKLYIRFRLIVHNYFIQRIGCFQEFLRILHIGQLVTTEYAKLESLKLTYVAC